MRYRTYADAERRVWRLVAEVGVWPGIQRCIGGWRLTYDPPGDLGEYTTTGYLRGG